MPFDQLPFIAKVLVVVAVTLALAGLVLAFRSED